MLLLGVVAVASSLAAFPQSTPLEGWSRDFQLSWTEHFKAEVPDNAVPNDPAAIYVEIKWYVFYDGRRSGSGWIGGVREAIVSNTLNPQLSWAQEGQKTDAALRHELYRFHLNEPFRERLEADLLAVRVRGRTKEELDDLLSRRAHEIGDHWLARADAEQNQYETQTRCGWDAEAQREWEDKIDSWLADPWSIP